MKKVDGSKSPFDISQLYSIDCIHEPEQQRRTVQI